MPVARVRTCCSLVFGKELFRDCADLRRTAASLMASGGVPRFVISRILNHSEEKDITSVYDRYSYDAEKRAAMEFWNRQLAVVLKGSPH